MKNASKSSVVKKDVLGCLALALFPLEKLKHSSPGGKPFEQEIHHFLVRKFNGYTVSSGNISGHWKDDAGHDHYGEHRAYKVALPNDELRAAFEQFLARMAREMGEECIYAEINGEILLIYQVPE